MHRLLEEVERLGFIDVSGFPIMGSASGASWRLNLKHAKIDKWLSSYHLLDGGTLETYIGLAL